MDLKVKRTSIRTFIVDLVQHCIKHNVTFNMSNKKDIFIEGLPCSGYFEGDIDKGELVVAVNKPQKKWLPVLIHESCHMDQWLENKAKFMVSEGIEVIDQWLNGKRVNKTILKKAIEATKKLELDCEIRSVAKIKKYKLPINIQEYIQMANTYIYFYNWVLENRKWNSVDKSLYQKEIYKLAPKEFQKNYKKTPDDLNEAFNKYL